MSHWSCARKRFYSICLAGLVHRILDYFEDRDIGVMDAYRNACIDDEEDDEFAKYFVEFWLDNDFVGYGSRPQEKAQLLQSLANYELLVAGIGRKPAS